MVLTACADRVPSQVDGGALDAGCPAGLTSCGGDCVDLLTSLDHCGACDDACDEARAGGGTPLCTQGQCFGGDSCTAPQKVCANSCTDIQNDNNNCGDCAIPCAQTKGYTCVAGNCVCAGGVVDCGSGCIETLSNDEHCGACDVVCTPPLRCNAGRCRAPCSPACADCCDGFCVDVSTALDHCGACGNQCCPWGATCTAGVCTSTLVCPTGKSVCGDPFGPACAECYDLNTDPKNCGTCGNFCGVEVECVSGECQ